MSSDPDITRYRTSEVPEPAPRVGVPRAGDVIDGKYRVERVLGVGGMGVVVAVTHLTLGEPYAIKFLLPEAAEDAEAVARFLREARAAVRIKSEHIVRVSDVGQLANGVPYILMEHLVGSDLGDVLERDCRLPIKDAVEYVMQACAGIAEAHALGFIHRDLKPSNLFLTQRSDGAPLVKVLDFGISKAINETSPHNPAITGTQAVFGSPAYMSPEQIRSAKNVDFRADVWALGVILFELLAGETPFKAETGGGLLAAIVADPPKSLRGMRSDVGEELEAIVLRCLEKDVTKRFQSVSELATALEPFTSADSVVSVGRIRRVGSAEALSARYSQPLLAPASSGSPVAKEGVTLKGGTTGVVRTRSGLAVLGGAVILAIAIVGSALYVKRSIVGATPSPSTVERPAESAGALTPTSVVASEQPTVPSSASPPPSAVSVSTAAPPKPHGAAKRPTAPAKSVANVSPSPPPATQKPPPLDPTAESH